MNRSHLVGHAFPSLTSVIIYNLYPVWAILSPHKAHTPLVIDPDAVLALPVSRQGFQAIAGQSSQVNQAGRTVQDLQASLCLCLHSFEAAHPLTMVEGFCILITKALDHAGRIAECYA
jgi:hypothetical protein